MYICIRLFDQFGKIPWPLRGGGGGGRDFNGQCPLILYKNLLPTAPNNLSGGQLLQIVKQAIKSLQDQANTYIYKLTKVEEKCNIVEAKLEKLEEDVGEKADIINKQSKDIESLKKIALAQQIFCERTQRKNLAKNLIITGISGISTENLIYNNQASVTPEEKLHAILSGIDISLNQEQYELYAFPPGEGRNTHSIKITVNLDVKKQILERAKMLKDTVFKGIFYKNG